MAKKDLAALAGLAGLAYMMNNKKEDVPRGKVDTGPGYTSTEERLESPQETITRSMAKAPGDSKPITESDVTMPEKATPAAPMRPRSLASSSVSTSDEDAAVPTKPLATPAQRTDQLANLSRAVNREAKTKYAATREPSDPAAKNKYYATGQDSDAMKVASRAAAKADFLRKQASGNAYKKGGAVKKMAKGGMTSKPSSASKRADGIASRGKTKCKMY